MARIFLDVTNTVRSISTTPNGIDRVERAFIRALLQAPNEWDVAYVCRNTFGFMKISKSSVEHFLNRFSSSEINVHSKNIEFQRIKQKLLSIGPFIRLEDADIYLECDAIRHLGRWPYFKSVRKKNNFHHVSFCHDLIPVKFPHWVKSNEYVERFRSGILVATAADTVICNSENTKNDFLEFCHQTKILPPKLTIIPLGCDTIHQTERPSQYQLPCKRFVLCVGSITDRKNHALLLNIWSEFSNNSKMGEIGLVIAGSKGNGADKIIERIKLDPRLQKSVIHIESPTDNELSWLYGNCLFSVYPSRYEGWGLPVTESLGYGKICITANTSSLPEAGEGFTIMLDPLDHQNWKETIINLVKNNELRLSLELKIKRAYIPRNWSMVSEDLRTLLSNIMLTLNK